MPRRREFLAAAGMGLLGGLSGCTASMERHGIVATEEDPESRSRTGSLTGRDSATDAAEDASPPGLGSAATELYRETIVSVVGILVYDESGRAATGSGFVTGLGPGGPHVVTNQHVVAPGNRFQIRFQGNEWRAGDIVGTDVYSDLAVLRPNNRPSFAASLDWADTDPEPPIGTDVLAIGSPFGLGGSASAGIISGVDRLLAAPNNFSIPDAVQTDAALNPGNSGGPIVTADGTVAAVASSAGGENIGFGISAALSNRVVPSLIADGEFRHSYMGVGIREVTPTAADAYELDDVGGLIVTNVVDSGPSEGVLEGSTDERVVDGVRVFVGGDVIVGIGGEPVEVQADLSNYLALETSPGDTVPVTVIRDGERTTVDLTLGRRPQP
jgi:S1-C subfamily serine protease